MEERKKMINLLKTSVINLGFSTDEKVIKKRNALLKVITLLEDEYHNFFSNIDMTIAYAILRDTGINENEIPLVYERLLKEELNNEYILIDEKKIQNH